MILRKTVLVLGAGASTSYGYPFGEKLKEEILGKIKNKDMRDALMQVHGFSEFTLDNFFTAFHLSSTKYIEDFLAERKEFEDVGKLVIAQVIKEYQNIEDLLKGYSWYSYLFNIMNDSFDNFGKNNLSIITFNFDLSLETFLFNALRNSYNKTELEVLNQIKLIPIVHFYGHVGKSKKVNEIIYKSDVPRNLSKEDCDFIRIFDGKNNVADSNTQKVKTLLDDAEVIVFLGFGYDAINMQKLDINKLENKKIVGSSFGIKPGEIKSIIKNSGNKLVFPKTKIAQAMDTLGFLRESGALEV